jgi:hypothetical protein
MQLHDLNSQRLSATLRRLRSDNSTRRRSKCGAVSRVRLASGFALACALLIACGDDGTEGLSSCPEHKIALDKNDLLRCAPVAKPAGAGGSSVKAGAAGAKSTNTATKPAPAGSSAASAANSGAAGAKPAAASGEQSAPAGSNPPASGGSTPSGGAPPASAAPPAAMSGGGNAPEVPSGPWSCLQYMDACSCVPSEGLGDSCTKPHPPCCTYVTMNGKVVACVCVPADSAQCNGMKSDPTTYPSASKCPP